MSATIGVIGCGKIAEKHLSAYNHLEDVEVIATDIDADQRQIAQQYGVDWCGSTDALLADSSVDAVDVCTPVSTHADLILDALAAEKDVFCEKPLARTLDEARLIQQRASDSASTLTVGYLYRYHPAFQFAAEVLRDRIIGEPHYAIFRVGGRGGSSAWKHKAGAGGGAVNEMLVHMLDLVIWYFDEIRHVETLQLDTLLRQRIINGQTVDATAEDSVLVRLKDGQGTNIICQSDLFTPSYMNYVEVLGSNGSLWTTILDYFPSFVYCKEPRGIYDIGHNFREFDHVNLFERELSEFVNQVAQSEYKGNGHSVAQSVELGRLIDDIIE